MITQRREARIFITLCIAFLVLLLGSFYIFMPKRERNNSLIQQNKDSDAYTLTVSIDSKIIEKERDVFVPKYQIIETVDYTQKISVPLWLSKETLKQNILHAAETLKRQTNAQKVIVYAYRQDDIERSIYTAGKCTLEQIPVFEWAKVYHQDKTIYKKGTQAIITEDKTNLYKQRLREPDKVIKQLKKGTRVTILESYRLFSTDELIDIYKVQLNKKISGWVLGSYLTPVLPKVDEPKMVKKKNNSNYYRGWNKPLYEGTVRDWRNASEREKLSTCEYFLENAYKNGFLNIKVDEYTMKYYSVELKACINTALQDDIPQFSEHPIVEIVAASLAVLGWTI